MGGIGLPALPDAAAAAVPPRPVTSYGRVVAQLRQEIIDNAVAPASWLRMSALAQRYGVSVQPIREALQQLQGEGLVEIFPNRGARVRRLDTGRLVHIYEIREAMESFMARRFAEEAALSDIRRLQIIQRAHDAAIELGDERAIGAANLDFHNLINSHAGNAEAHELVVRYYALSQSLRLRAGYGPPYWRRARDDHHRLIAAFERRDAWEAARIGAHHVRASRNDLLARLDLPDGRHGGFPPPIDDSRDMTDTPAP